MSELLPISDSDLADDISELEHRIKLAIESFGSAPAAMRQKLATYRELQELRRRASPPAQTGELLRAMIVLDNNIRALGWPIAKVAEEVRRLAQESRSALTHSPGPAEARWVPSLSAKRYSGWSVAMMANSPTTEYVAACDYDSLAAAFKKYGHHTWDESGEPCAKDFGVACTCGFDSALSQSRQQGEP